MSNTTPAPAAASQKLIGLIEALTKKVEDMQTANDLKQAEMMTALTNLRTEIADMRAAAPKRSAGSRAGGSAKGSSNPKPFPTSTPTWFHEQMEKNLDAFADVFSAEQITEAKTAVDKDPAHRGKQGRAYHFAIATWIWKNILTKNKTGTEANKIKAKYAEAKAAHEKQYGSEAAASNTNASPDSSASDMQE